MRRGGVVTRVRREEEGGMWRLWTGGVGFTPTPSQAANVARAAREEPIGQTREKLTHKGVNGRIWRG